MMNDADPLQQVAQRYAVAVTPTIDGLIDKTDPFDPIALQFLPDARELATLPEERIDPIGDDAHAPAEGIVHRYPDRVLLKPVHVCPAYCRFCFRREMVGPGKRPTLSRAALDGALNYIATHPEIWEVILTGGDPFLLSPRRARDIVQRLSAMDHVKVIRWHTRVPIVDPQRVTPTFVKAIRTDKATYVALHANHPRELTAEARAACARLIEAGIPMLGQSVLLRGVNDNIETLSALMRAFVETRIKPYYLHHPDLAPGTSHFRMTLEEGRALISALRDAVSGLCQPTYVLDIPGGVSKAVASASDVDLRDGACAVRGRDGAWRAYP